MAGAIRLVTGQAGTVDPDELVGRGELHDVILRVAHVRGGKTRQGVLEYDERGSVRQ
jgi:hypothetical protein